MSTPRTRLDELRTVTFTELNARSEAQSWRDMQKVAAVTARLERLGRAHLRFGVPTFPN